MEQDLTGRARIRDAALVHFAEHGERAATLRSIADAAGVTAGLVRHHFGSKQGLRAACDAYVLDVLRRETAVVSSPAIADPATIRTAYATYPWLSRYVARALVEGGPAGTALFDELVAMTEAFLAGHLPRDDPRAQASVLVAMKLGVTLLDEQLFRTLGDEPPIALARISRAMVDLLVPEVMGAEQAELARTGLDRYRALGAES